MKANLIEKSDKVAAKTYARFPIVIEKGKGCKVTDIDGKEYIDFIAGIAVCSLGHCHPRVSKALKEQADTLFHVSNLYYTVPQIQLASMLVENSFADRAFFCNSGAEANEAAIKLARKYFSAKGEPHKFRILAMEKSFHGRTMATLSATGQDKIKKGFDPVLDGFDFAKFNDIESLKENITQDTGAVLTEPIQAEGGINCPSASYLKEVRRICDEKGILLIFDEVQTGIGRTGKLFCYENFDVVPDIMTLAKALGNGLPIGAMLAKEEVAQAFGPGSHATTFGGTPIITAAAFEVLKTILETDVLKNCREAGNFFKEKLLWLKSRHNIVEDIRGMGLLLGMKLKQEGAGLVQDCMEKGFLINCIQGNILRFAPPLIVDKASIESLIDCLDKLL